jgi:hypothetical protein
MYKFILSILITLCLSSCGVSRLTPLSTRYNPDPQMILDMHHTSKDVVWTRLLGFFDKHHWPIKEMNKESGFMESDLLSFVRSYQVEGVDEDTSKHVHVIVQREMFRDQLIQPTYISGFVSVSISQDTNITQACVSIEGLMSYHDSETYRDVVSTTNLEVLILDYLQTGIDTVPLNVDIGEMLNPRSNYEDINDRIARNGELVGALLGAVGDILGSVSTSGQKSQSPAIPDGKHVRKEPK